MSKRPRSKATTRKPAKPRKVAKPTVAAGRVSSLRQLAARLGVSAEAARKWPAHPTWDFGAMPTPVTPWDAATVERVRQWRISNLKEDTAEAGAAGRHAQDRNKQAQQAALAKTLKVAEEARRIKRENDLAEGLLVRREEVERQNIEKIQAVKSGLLGLVEEMRETFSDEQVEELEDRITALLKAFAGD